MAVELNPERSCLQAWETGFVTHAGSPGSAAAQVCGNRNWYSCCAAACSLNNTGTASVCFHWLVRFDIGHEQILYRILWRTLERSISLIRFIFCVDLGRSLRSGDGVREMTGTKVGDARWNALRVFRIVNWSLCPFVQGSCLCSEA